MRVHSISQPRILAPTRCRVGPRLHTAAAPLPSLRTALCRSAATESLSFEELLAAEAPGQDKVQQAAAAAAAESQQEGQQQQQPQGGGSKVKPGDVVLGMVVGASPKGAKIQILDGSDTIGYMPVKEAPYHMREADEEDLWGKASDDPCVPKGLVREFKVVALQQHNDTLRSGQPLLSARELDQDMMWRRAMQIMQTCVEYKENVRCKIDGANAGGLTSRLTGLNLFVPVSQLEKKESGEWWSEETMAREFVGKEVHMCVVEVARKSRKVVGSLVRAKENDALRALEVGSLVSGTVRRVEPFGVFVGIDGCRESGLIHISNISRTRVAHPSSVFQVGDKVKCILMGMDPDHSNISLSTAELEKEEGDMQKNKQAVWDGAEEQTALFQQHLQRLKASGFDFEAYYKDATHV